MLVRLTSRIGGRPIRNHQQYEPQYLTRAKRRQQSQLSIWSYLLVSFATLVMKGKMCCWDWAGLSRWERLHFTKTDSWTNGTGTTNARLSHAARMQCLIWTTRRPWPNRCHGGHCRAMSKCDPVLLLLECGSVNKCRWKGTRANEAKSDFGPLYSWNFAWTLTLFALAPSSRWLFPSPTKLSFFVKHGKTHEYGIATSVCRLKSWSTS